MERVWHLVQLNGQHPRGRKERQEPEELWETGKQKMKTQAVVDEG